MNYHYLPTRLADIKILDKTNFSEDVGNILSSSKLVIVPSIVSLDICNTVLIKIQ
jgi:hypothetical protein